MLTRALSCIPPKALRMCTVNLLRWCFVFHIMLTIFIVIKKPVNFPPPPPASYILVGKMKQILCSTDWWLEWAVLLLILCFVSARKRHLFWSIINPFLTNLAQTGGVDNGLVLIVFVCLFVAVEKDEKTWPTHPAILTYHLSQKHVLFVTAHFFVKIYHCHHCCRNRRMSGWKKDKPQQQPTQRAKRALLQVNLR